MRVSILLLSLLFWFESYLVIFCCLAYAKRDMIKKHHQSGFGIVGIIAIVLAMGIAAAVGWLGYSNFIKKTPPTHMVQASTSLKPSDSPATQSDLPNGWKWCVDNADGFKFAHPSDWKYNWITVQSQWAAQSQAFDKGMCSTPGGLAPQTQLSYLQNKYGSSSSPLLSYGMIPSSKAKAYDTITKMYDSYKSEEVSGVGYVPKPSMMLTINGLSGFYINQVTNSYSNNIYVVQLSNGSYIEFDNRESDKHYRSGQNAAVDDQNDYTQYTSVVEQIVKTLHTL
jgi:hypothetical protein